MLFSLVPPIARPLSFPVYFRSRQCFRTIFASKIRTLQMGHENLQPFGKRRHAKFRLCNVSGYKTDLLEIHAEEPKLHVLFIPGNPGAISFYTEFLESLYEILGGTASVTAIGHISHTGKNWEHGRLFSLEEQIDHKMNFMKHNLQDIEVPLVLVGHSIGSYISIEMFRRSPGQVIYCIGLYPFLAVNTKSSTQSVIREIAASPFVCATISSLVGMLGLLPSWVSRFLVKKSVGKSWSATAVDALCNDLLQYHTMRNVLFMAMTEFKKISNQVPGVVLDIEREGHTHAFSCTEAGSLWAAHHIASLIKAQISR